MPPRAADRMAPSCHLTGAAIDHRPVRGKRELDRRADWQFSGTGRPDIAVHVARVLIRKVQRTAIELGRSVDCSASRYLAGDLPGEILDIPLARSVNDDIVDPVVRRHREEILPAVIGRGMESLNAVELVRQLDIVSSIDVGRHRSPITTVTRTRRQKMDGPSRDPSPLV